MHMRSRRSRSDEARRVSGLAVVATIMLAAALVAGVIVIRAYVSHHGAGSATRPGADARTGAARNRISPVPTVTRTESATASPARAPARPAPATARPAHPPASPARPSASPSHAPASPSPVQSNPVTRPPHRPGRWIITKSLLSKISRLDAASARWFFNSPRAFVKGPPISGFAATPLAGYTSYAQFAHDLADGSFPAGVKWVMFGLESTTDSPVAEKQNPGVYLKDFALLAHRHNLRVVEVPGRDLVGVPGAACQARPGEKYDHAFLRCHIPADARYADVLLTEAQGDQSDVSAYTALVTAATRQVRAQAPRISVMAGLTTDRGDSAGQIFGCWKATHAAVSGYWMNSTSSTLPVAARVFDQIRAAAPGASP